MKRLAALKTRIKSKAKGVKASKTGTASPAKRNGDEQLGQLTAGPSNHGAISEPRNYVAVSTEAPLEPENSSLAGNYNDQQYSAETRDLSESGVFQPSSRTSSPLGENHLNFDDSQSLLTEKALILHPIRYAMPTSFATRPSTMQQPRVADALPDLWDKAYEALKVQNEYLMDTYEEILASTTTGSSSGISNWKALSGQQRQNAMAQLIAKEMEAKNQAKWRLRLGKKTIEFEEQFNRIVKLVANAKDAITAAVAPSPHAAIAWAGVCILLPVLLNPRSQFEANIEGIEYISTLISRCNMRERTYRTNAYFPLEDPQSKENLKVQVDLEEAMTKLYIHILEYQARTVCQVLRGSVFRTGRDIFKADDWNGLIDKMKNADTTCNQFTQTIDSERLRSGFTNISQMLDKQSENLDRLLQGTNPNALKAYYNVLRILKTSDYLSTKDKNPPRVPGTCLWFSGHQKFQNWLSQEASLLWVSADPGCGKSVLARFLVDEELPAKLQSPKIIGYYFFKDDDQKHRSALHAICAVLHQILVQDSELIHRVMKFFNRTFDQGGKNSKSFGTQFDISEAWQPTLNEAWEILTFCAEEKNIACVIDALDECEQDSRELLLSYISRYFQNQSRRSGKLKIVLTSRPWSSISDALFYGSGLTRESIHLMGEDEAEVRAISEEIELVIKTKVLEFNDFRKWKGIEDDAYLQLQVRLLSTRNRTYLWVSLIFSELQKNAAEAKGVLLRLIATLPRSIDEAYERILNQSSDFHRARKLLHIIVAAARPLTVQEINVAISIQDGDQCLEDIDLTPASSFTKVLRELCGLFVNVVDDKIYLAHQTAKDFLQKPTGTEGKFRNSSGWKHSLDPRESHETLAWSCMRYLLLDDFEVPHFPVRVSDIFEPQDFRSTPVPYLGNPLAPYRLRRRSQIENSGGPGAIHSNELDYVPTPDKVVSKVTSKYHFLSYSAIFWYSHYNLAERPDQLVNVAIQLYQIKSPRGQLWRAVYSHAPYTTLLPYALKDGDELVMHSYLGDLKAVQRLLTYRERSPKSQSQAKTALRFAIEFGRIEIVREILTAAIGAAVDCTFDDYTTPLSCAVVMYQPKAVELFFQLGLEKVTNHSLLTKAFYDVSAMYIAPGTSQFKVPYESAAEVVALLLKNGAKINQCNFRGETALMRAVEHKYYEGVRVLLDSNSGEFDSKIGGWHDAASKRYPELDLEEKLDINAKDSAGFASLHRIYVPVPGCPLPGDFQSHESFDFWMNEQNKVFKYLLAKGADPYIKTPYGETPLHLAVRQQAIEIARMLLEMGVDVNTTTSQGSTPLHYVLYGSYCKVPTDYKAEFKTKCHCASKETMLDFLLKHKADIEAKDEYGNTALHMAAAERNMEDMEVLNYLVAHKANVDSRAIRGVTPLYYAIYSDSYRATQKLVESGADVNLQDDLGFTPLGLSVQLQKAEMLVSLLSQGLDINSAGKRSKTLLHLAVDNGDIRMTAIILTLSADVTITDDGNWNPLHYAASKGNFYIVWMLIRANKLDPLSKTFSGSTALDLAVNGLAGLHAMTDVLVDESSPEAEHSSRPMAPVGHDSTEIEISRPPKGDANIPISTDIKEDSPIPTSLNSRFSRASTIPKFSGQKYSNKTVGRYLRKHLQPRLVSIPQTETMDMRVLANEYFLVREDLSEASEDLDIIEDKSISNGDSASVRTSEIAPSESPSRPRPINRSHSGSSIKYVSSLRSVHSSSTCAIHRNVHSMRRYRSESPCDSGIKSNENMAIDENITTHVREQNRVEVPVGGATILYSQRSVGSSFSSKLASIPTSPSTKNRPKADSQAGTSTVSHAKGEKYLSQSDSDRMWDDRSSSDGKVSSKCLDDSGKSQLSSIIGKEKLVQSSADSIVDSEVSVAQPSELGFLTFERSSGFDSEHIKLWRQTVYHATMDEDNVSQTSHNSSLAGSSANESTGSSSPPLRRVNTVITIESRSPSKNSTTSTPPDVAKNNADLEDLEWYLRGIFETLTGNQPYHFYGEPPHVRSPEEEFKRTINLLEREMELVSKIQGDDRVEDKRYLWRHEPELMTKKKGEIWIASSIVHPGRRGFEAVPDLSSRRKYRYGREGYPSYGRRFYCVRSVC